MSEDEYDYDGFFYGEYGGDYGTPKERVYSYVDVLIWLVFPTAAIGFISSITSLVFVALFPKPLKTTIIHCIVLCVASVLTCMISIAQASTWEILEDLKSRGEEEEFIIVDFSISWITILLLGVANWLFVAFVAIRLYAICRVDINSYNNYVAASANEVDRSERSKPSYVCGVVTVILCFGWLLPTFVLPLLGMIEFYNNWLAENEGVTDVSKFAFQYDFSHRWGAVIYVLLPIGLIVLISGVIIFQTAIKFRGLKFMRSKWDKAKFTLGVLLLFLTSRIPMLVYVLFAFVAYPPAPGKTGDEDLDRKLANEHQTYVYVGNLDVKKRLLGPTGPICLLFASGAAVLNFPLFYLCFRRFRSLVSEARVNCSNCQCCDELKQSNVAEDSEISSTDADAREVDGSYIANSVALENSFTFKGGDLKVSPNSYRVVTPDDNHRAQNPQNSPGQGPNAAGNFFFNSAHLNGNNRDLAQSSSYHSKPIKGDFV